MLSCYKKSNFLFDFRIEIERIETMEQTNFYTMDKKINQLHKLS